MGALLYSILWPIFMSYTCKWSPNGDQAVRGASQYDITMGNDIARMPIVKLQWLMLGDIYCDVTMNNDVALCTYHSITMHNNVAMNLFYYLFSALYIYFILRPVFIWYTRLCSANGDQSGQLRSINMRSQCPLIMTSQWVITLLRMCIVKSQ